MGDKELNRLLEKVSEDNCKKSFDRIFNYYYPKLVDFADLYLESHEAAEEIASDVLLNLFVKRHSWMFVEKPEAYLFKSVKNLSISHLRKTKKDNYLTRLDKKTWLNHATESDSSPERKLIEEEFYNVVLEIIERMPPRRKMIFKLVKQGGKSYKEVSGLLNISVKTVEVHMGLAISHIRESLEKYEKQNNTNYLLTVVKSILFIIIPSLLP